MTGVAEVGGPEAEENRYGAAVAAFVFEKIGRVFGTHLSSGHVRTGAANQFGRIEVGAAQFQVASGFSSVISLKKWILFEHHSNISAEISDVLDAVICILNHFERGNPSILNLKKFRSVA